MFLFRNACPKSNPLKSRSYNLQGNFILYYLFAVELNLAFIIQVAIIRKTGEAFPVSDYRKADHITITPKKEEEK